MSLADLSLALQGLQSNPMFTMGAGLMSASGPSLMPHSFGQDLAKGMDYSQQAMERAAQARMVQLQAQRYGLQNSAIRGVLDGGANASNDFASPDQASAASANLMPAGITPQAPMLSSANGTPGTSYAAPGASLGMQPGTGSTLGQGMMHDPMFKLGFAFDPSAASTQYLNRAYPQPTDFVKQLDAAGIDPNSQIGHQLIQQNIAKQNYITPTRVNGGGGLYDPVTSQFRMIPHAIAGTVPVQLPNGQWVAEPVGGAQQAITAASAAQASGKAAVTPYSGMIPDGKGGYAPVNTTQLGYVNAVTPKPGSPTSPDQIVGTLAARATQMVKEGIPQDVTQAWLQRQMQAANIGAQPVVTTASSSASPASAGGIPGAISGPPPGYVQGQETVAKANAQRYQDVINTGAQAASRMNVYDNLRGLLNDGVQTGYGTEWQNHALSTIMNTPVLSSMIPANLQNKAISYQVAMKYIAQGTLQRFQGQKGTGTDSQLEAVAHGNTNPEQLAGAMSQVSRYLESQDMADLAKSNAQQQWAAQNGYDYAKQDRFENEWRQHNNPLVFQYKSGDPATQKQILGTLTTAQKVKLAHDMQFMSPFITSTPAGQ